MSSSLFSHKTVCIITGAGRGYGRCILEKFAGSMPAGSTFLVLARNLEKLKSASKTVMEQHPTIKVVPIKFDQGVLSECSMESVHQMMQTADISPGQFEQAVIVHNSGTLGDVTKFAAQMTDSKMVEETMNINITGTIVFNASVLSLVKEVKLKVVINVSSLSAIQPFSSWSLYCTGKAARDMFFKTLAVEEKTIQVLNWAPGPLDTDMQAICRTCADQELRKNFQDMHREGKLLSCESSVDKLIILLEKMSFQSGDHIDIYDV